MNLKYIFKILDKEEWNNAKKDGKFSGSSKDINDGYIPVSYTHLTLPTNREV